MPDDDASRRGTLDNPTDSPTAGADLDEVRAALEDLVQLQAHYAMLLNIHDGGQRHGFTSADEWIERRRELRHEYERRLPDLAPGLHL